MKCTFASTRSVQIATCIQLPFCRRAGLCLHTLRADCNVVAEKPRWINVLCLHTLRADCNGSSLFPFTQQVPFASTRSVQIATTAIEKIYSERDLCLHTLRADCNQTGRGLSWEVAPLPPHAPCRLQPDVPRQPARHRLCLHTLRADCNRRAARREARPDPLPPHAPCRLQPGREGAQSGRKPLPPHAPCRLQRQKCTELQYALFRTCVESVDSFSVLNKSMLR